MIHLDTNFLIGLSQADSEQRRKLENWMRGRQRVGTSAVAWAEFLCGPLPGGGAASIALVVGDPLPFTAEDATRAALLFNATGRRRGSLIDCMIAAAALRAGASVATSDAGHFDRFVAHGLRLAE